MSNVKNYDYDCTRKCRCRQHGNTITAALGKRSIKSENLAAFIAKTCCNFPDIVDDLGRSAVHLAASVNRYDILEWLLNQGAIINGRDFESGSSALHRAIYYGCIDCAVLLLRYGASLELLDEDTRCALQNVCRLRDFPKKAEVSSNNEILVWGSNKNYNLGAGKEEGANTPQSIDYFRKEHISVEAVALGAYHSLFLDKKSNLYAVGHGKGGRLGIGTENSLTTPKKVKVPIKNSGEVIICVDVSSKHSLLLTNFSAVYACGLNEDHQLGVRDATEKLTVFKEVVALRDFGVENLLRVIARDYHSLAYSNEYIYVWGTNHGQMGINAATKVVSVPKQMKLPPSTYIEFVEGNNFATVVYTKENLLLFYNAKMKTIKPPNFEALKSVALVGGDNIKSAKGSATALKLLILTQTNVVFLWYEMTQNFYRCIFSQLRITQIDKIFYRGNQVLILSQGDVYRGKCTQIPFPNAVRHVDGMHSQHRRSSQTASIWSRCDDNRVPISKEHMISIDLERMPTIDRAVDINCDDDFSAFAVLQESHMKYFKLPNLMPEEYSFKKLYNDVSEHDAVHDVVFHVDDEVFPAHKLIVYARAPGLCEIISSYVDKHIYLNFTNLTSKMFEIMLKHMYTNYLPNEDDLDDIQHSLGPDSPSERREICDFFLNFVEKFQIRYLTNFLKSFLQQRPFYLPHLADKSKYRFNRLRHADFPELYDVRIICAEEVELPAHKCILTARLEYFEMMFTHSWAEQTTINLSTVHVDYMKPIIDFLYSADVEQFRKQQYSETYLYNMIVYCDQFFIDRLRKVCEILILDKITIRKCGDMLNFANMYHCEILKKKCLEFVCQNLARVLAYKSLDCCEPDALKCINDFYRQMFKEVFDYRMITPDSEGVSDEMLLSFVEDFSVDLDYRMDENETLKYKASIKQKDNRSKQSARQYEKEAIVSMMESMKLNEISQVKTQSVSKALQEAKSTADKLQAESKNWTKVVDKKDNKKKVSLELALKANDMLTLEEKPKAEFVKLNKKLPEKTFEKANTPEKEVGTKTYHSSEPTTPDKIYNISLAELTSPREKLSQKQRKRLSSTSTSASTSTLAALLEENTQPVTVLTTPNAWGVIAQSPTSSSFMAYSKTPPTGSAADATSFANMMRGSPAKVAHEQQTTSFSTILADEKKQREYFERMRTKSLVLTQIEETAIQELRAFYNVDNVADEIITIERKPMPSTMNFAIWQRH